MYRPRPSKGPPGWRSRSSVVIGDSIGDPKQKVQILLTSSDPSFPPSSMENMGSLRLVKTILLFSLAGVCMELTL